MRFWQLKHFLLKKIIETWIFLLTLYTENLMRIIQKYIKYEQKNIIIDTFSIHPKFRSILV